MNSSVNFSEINSISEQYIFIRMRTQFLMNLFVVLFVFQACRKPLSNDSQQLGEIYFADPTVFYENGKYYLTGTRNIEPLGFTIMRSDDLKIWSDASTDTTGMLLKQGEYVYGNDGFWAPQLLNENGTYYLTYTANEQTALAKSGTLTGLYAQDKISAIDSSEKNIDSFMFKDDDGKFYLYHVRFDNGNYIWVGEFDFQTGKIKSETLRKCFGITQSWEATPAYQSAPIMEGPTVIKMEGRYYMFYSANHFQSIDYAVGYATATSPFGPWEKYAGNPIIHRSIVKENGAGHGDLFFDKNKKPYYVYHVHNSDSTVVPRKTRIIPLIFTKNAQSGLYNIAADPEGIIVPLKQT